MHRPRVPGFGLGEVVHDGGPRSPLVEGGDETLVLTLSAPTMGKLGGAFGSRVHTLTLEETDIADLGLVLANSATSTEGARSTESHTSCGPPHDGCRSRSG